MNEKKLDLILSKLENLEGEVKDIKAVQRSQGEHIQQLIQIVGTTNAKLEELTEDVRQIKNTIHIFRSESDVNFRKFDRRVKLIESDLDETMSKVAEITQPKS